MQDIHLENLIHHIFPVTISLPRTQSSAIDIQKTYRLRLTRHFTPDKKARFYPSVSQCRRLRDRTEIERKRARKGKRGRGKKLLQKIPLTFCVLWSTRLSPHSSLLLYIPLKLCTCVLILKFT